MPNSNPVFDISNEHVNVGGIIEIYVPENTYHSRFVSGFDPNGPISDTGIWQPIVIDPDLGQTLTYSIVPFDGTNSGGLYDSAQFNIDSVTGVLTLKPEFAPDFENPNHPEYGPGFQNLYQVTVQVEDGNGGIARQNVNVGALDQNDPPGSVTSTPGGTGTDISLNVPENVTAVTTFSAPDQDPGQTHTWELYTDPGFGTPDWDKFDLNPTTGELTWKVAPDAENPTDAYNIPGDNQYGVAVRVFDGAGGINYQTLTVNVVGVNEVPVITSYNGNPEQVDINVTENTTAVADVDATDPEGQPITYELAQTGDWEKFTLDSSTGELSFTTPPDFENPTDVGVLGEGGQDGIYNARVLAHDPDGGTNNQEFQITVQDDPTDNPPVFTSFGGVDGPVSLNVNENVKAVTTVHATDVTNQPIVYSIDPNVGDASKFVINPTTGAIAFKQAPDFEHPTDVGTPGQGGQDGVYDVGVIATDSTGRTDEQTLRLFTQNDPLESHNLSGGATSDTLIGENGPDTISGGDGIDYLVGHGGLDKITGDKGNDFIAAGPGGTLANPQSVDGGAGTDYMLFSGARTDYTFSFDKKGALTTVTGLIDGSVTSVKNVEVYHFEGDHSNYQVAAAGGSLVTSTDTTANPIAAAHHDWLI